MAKTRRPLTNFEPRSVVAVRADVAADDDGIQRGDYLLVRPEPRAAAGATVVAVVDGRLSVRRLVRGTRGERQLVPVNPHVLPLVLPAERARILGPLVGVLRQRRGQQTATPASLPVREAEADPALNMIDDTLDESTGARTSELARDLRSLRDCYLSTSVPRLRQALLREARSCVDALRRMLAAERRRSA